MPKRTQIKDYEKIESGEDLERLVKDKREAHRGGKPKKNRRHRHYVKTMLRHLTEDTDAVGDDEV